MNNHIKNKHPTINLASEDDANVKMKSEEFVENLNHKQQTLMTLCDYILIFLTMEMSLIDLP